MTPNTPTQLLALASAATPGPWTMEGPHVLDSAKEGRICRVFGNRTAALENQLLIAACSPSLIKPLAALWAAAQSFSEHYDGQNDAAALDNLRAALLALSSMGKGE